MQQHDDIDHCVLDAVTVKSTIGGWQVSEFQHNLDVANDLCELNLSLVLATTNRFNDDLCLMQILMSVLVLQTVLEVLSA